MSHRKQVSPNNGDLNIEISFSNWVAQVSNIMMPRNLDALLGRGSSKTTEFQVERLIEIIYDMPGAPLAWVADTFSNLNTNVLPMVLEGLERKGYKEGIHYIIEKPPPSYTAKEIEQLPSWLQPRFWRPFNKIVSYKRTIIFFTGTNITFGSLDRPASLAGRSYVHVFGDEVKYFSETKIANLLKAVRGYAVQYGHSPFYRGHTFTTDMPNTNNVGEHDWIIKQGKKMNVEAMVLLLKAGLVVNQVKHEIVALLNEGKKDEAAAKRNLLCRWEDRLLRLRKSKECHNLFIIASSFVNVDILTPQWFEDAFESELSDVNTAILSMSPSLSQGGRFYANISERNFFSDGNDSHYSEVFGLQESEDSRILKHLHKDKAIDIGVDFGNMCSLIAAQEDGKLYRCLKTIHTLSPEFVEALGARFVSYFKHHNHKLVNMYYDRAGNNFKKAGQDLATKLKAAIERDAEGHPTGWRVVLMSLGQGNIPQHEEFIFMQDLFSEHNANLPKVRIDMYNCKPLKCSLESAPTRINDKGIVVKDKRSEKLPIHRLPTESTNYSDAFKYLMMRKVWRRAGKGISYQTMSDPSVRG